MAKLLLHNKAAPLHPTDDQVNLGMFVPGDVVTMVEDDEDFGSDDLGDWNVVCYITGTVKDLLEHLVTPQYIENNQPVGGIDVITREMTKLRLWNSAPGQFDQLQTDYGETGVLRGTSPSDVVVFTTTYFTRADPVV